MSTDFDGLRKSARNLQKKKSRYGRTEQRRDLSREERGCAAVADAAPARLGLGCVQRLNCGEPGINCGEPGINWKQHGRDEHERHWNELKRRWIELKQRWIEFKQHWIQRWNELQ